MPWHASAASALDGPGTTSGSSHRSPGGRPSEARELTQGTYVPANRAKRGRSEAEHRNGRSRYRRCALCHAWRCGQRAKRASGNRGRSPCLHTSLTAPHHFRGRTLLAWQSAARPVGTQPGHVRCYVGSRLPPMLGGTPTAFRWVGLVGSMVC